MYVTFCCISKPKTEPTEGESPPERGVTTDTADLWCKDTTFLITCQ